MPVPEDLHCYCQPDAYPPAPKGGSPFAVTMLLTAMAEACKRLPGWDKFTEVVDGVISEINELERPKDVMSLSGFFDTPRWKPHRAAGLKKKDLADAMIEHSLNGEADLRRVMAYEVIGRRLREADVDEAFAVLIRGHLEADLAINQHFRRQKMKEEMKAEMENHPILKMFAEAGIKVEVIDLR